MMVDFDECYFFISLLFWLHPLSTLHMLLLVARMTAHLCWRLSIWCMVLAWLLHHRLLIALHLRLSHHRLLVPLHLRLSHHWLLVPRHLRLSHHWLLVALHLHLRLLVTWHSISWLHAHLRLLVTWLHSHLWCSIWLLVALHLRLLVPWHSISWLHTHLRLLVAGHSTHHRRTTHWSLPISTLIRSDMGCTINAS